MKVLEHLCEEGLKRLGFQCLKRKRLKGAVVIHYKVITALIKLNVDLNNSYATKGWGKARSLGGDSLKQLKKNLELVAPEGCEEQTLSVCSERRRMNSWTRSPGMVTKMTTQTCTPGILHAAAVEEQITGSGQSFWYFLTEFPPGAVKNSVLG